MRLSELRTAIAFYQGKIQAQINRDPLYEHNDVILISLGVNEQTVFETSTGSYRTFKTIDTAVRVVHQLGLSHALVDTQPK